MVRALASSTWVDRIRGLVAGDPRLKRSTTRAGASYAARNLLSEPAILEFCRTPDVRQLLSSLGHESAFPVRAILFDKPAGGNWRVGWHQDLIVPVQSRVDVAGFTAWSIKAGVPHVKPPAVVLEKMLTLRVHLDDCGPDNGPLQVAPGSHLMGELTTDQVQRILAEQESELCTAVAGDALVMRPLLLHSSAKAIAPSHRRVLHVEFASEGLPGGLEWPSHA